MYNILYNIQYTCTGPFCDGARQYGVSAPFFPSKEKTIICNVYC